MAPAPAERHRPSKSFSAFDDGASPEGGHGHGHVEPYSPRGEPHAGGRQSAAGRCASMGSERSGSPQPVMHAPGVAPALAHPHGAGGPSGTGYSRLHRKRSASALARPGSPADALAEVEAPAPAAPEPVAEAAVPEAAVPEAGAPNAAAPEAAAREEGDAKEQEEGPQQGEAASAAQRRDELLREEQRAAERQRAEAAAAKAAREIAAAAFAAAAAAPTAAEPAGQAQPEPVLAKSAAAAAEADATPAKPAAAKPFSYAAAAAKPAPAAEAAAEPPKPAKPAPAASAKPVPAPTPEAVPAAAPVAASAAAPQSEAVAAAKPADAPASGRERYRELLFRLGTFLPTVKDAAAACADATDHASFEATWELLKAELTSLVAAARVASAQASRLALLDREVTRLTTMLAALRRSVAASDRALADGKAAPASGPCSPTAAPGRGGGAAAPAGGSDGLAPKAASHESGKPAGADAPLCRGAWGRSVAPQESGLWSSGHHAARAQGQVKGSARRAGALMSAPQPQPQPQAKAAPASPRGPKAPTVHPKLSPEAIEKLVALYRPRDRVMGCHELPAAEGHAPLDRTDSGFRRAALAGPAALAVLGEQPGFAAAKEAFLGAGAQPSRHMEEKWATRMSARTASTAEVDASMARLAKALACHGAPVQMRRLAPSTFLVSGRRLHIRQANGQLLVRTGGGFEDLLSVLAKLPASAAQAPAEGPAKAALLASGAAAPEAGAATEPVPAAAGQLLTA